MAPYYQSLGEPVDMSQDTSVNDLFSDDEDDLFDDLPTPSVTPVPDVVPADNSLPQLLARSCGTENYENLTSVQLKVIASQTSLQRLHIYLPHLVELDLTGSHLQSLRTLGYGLDSLSVLRVGRCALTTLDGLFGVSGLKELYAAHNSISELGLLPTLPFLTVLDLTRNLVANLLQVGFLSLCDELRELTLSDCPVCQLPGYKASVLTTLPRLTQLDGLLLAEAGTDRCGDGKPATPDSSDREDGATALSIENINMDTASDVELGEPIKGRRPATVSGPRTVRAPLVLPNRPVTAGPKRQTPLISSVQDTEVVSDTVSKLTSGGVVCGNLAAALRSKHRQHKPAWAAQEGDKETISCRNGLHVTQLYSEVEELHLTSRDGGGDTHSRPAAPSPLLTASRQWREAYHSFRKAHREQWKKEEEEDGA